MKKASTDEILDDFVEVLNQIDNKPADEIESNLQKVIHKIRPLLHVI